MGKDRIRTARSTSPTFPIGADTEKKPASATTTYYLGQALVVRADAQTATCRVLRTVEELQIGDTLTH